AAIAAPSCSGSARSATSGTRSSTSASRPPRTTNSSRLRAGSAPRLRLAPERLDDACDLVVGLGERTVGVDDVVGPRDLLADRPLRRQAGARVRLVDVAARHRPQ